MPGEVTPPGFQPSRFAVALFYIAVTLVALFPVALVELPALADLPNHLARVHIINRLPQDPALQALYALHWQVMNFQSTDLLLPPLAKLVGLETAGRIYIVATFLLILGGTATLHRVLFGRVGLWPAAAALLFYNFMLAWGLISVLFAIGLMLLLFAAWIATVAREGLLRSALFAVAALALFLCHFFAFAAYAVLVVTFECGRLLPGKRIASASSLRALALCGATLVAPTVLFFMTLDMSGRTITAWGGLNDKIRMILSPMTMYLARPDFALPLVALGLVWLARRRDMFDFARRMAMPTAALAVLMLLMPNQLASVWGADFRLPTILCLCLVAATELRFRSRHEAMATAALLLTLLLVRVGFVAHDWRHYQAEFDELRAAAATIEPGARVVALQTIEDHRPSAAPSLFPYRHAVTLLMFDRDVFLPQLFTVATPLRLGAAGQAMQSDQLAVLRDIHWQPKNPAFATVDAATVDAVEKVGRKVSAFEVFSSRLDWSDWPERFDYLVDFDFGPHTNPVPALLTEIAVGSYFAIYRIHPPGG